MKTWKRWLAGLVGLVVLAGAGFAVLAWRPAIDPVAPSAAADLDATLVAKGQKLAAAGFCVTCHTAPGGKPFAGGLPMTTQFGTIYSTNLTPSVATGLGGWSLEAFTRAMHEGVARDGSHLFPVFPYDRFTQASDEDVKAIYTYLMSLPPVEQATPAPQMPFPLGWRPLQAGWKLLFFKEGRYQPDAAQSAEWNRGAYLAEGLSHCASCHTPRNGLGAEKGGAARYSGAAIEGWFAPALTAANTAPIPWTSQELYGYLRHGGTALHGVAAGPMSHVVYEGLALVDEPDVKAIATYFSSLNGSAQSKVDVAQVVQKTLAQSRFDPQQSLARGANVYAAACAACHYNTLQGPLAERPELGLKSSLTAADPDNLVQVIVHGISLQQGLPKAMMPAFGHALSDADIAALVGYLRQSRTTLPPWNNVEATVARVRAEPAN